MAKLRLVTNKGLQMLGEATGEDVVVFSRAYVSNESFNEEQIYAMETPTGTKYTEIIQSSLLNGEYIISAVFSDIDTNTRSVILCGRLRSQEDNQVTPVCVYSSDIPLGMNSAESTITFRLNFTSETGEGVIDVGDGQSMSRGEIIAYINQLFHEASVNGGYEGITVGGDQTITGKKRFTQPITAPAIYRHDETKWGVEMTDDGGTVIRGSESPCFGRSAEICVNTDTIELKGDDVLIPFNGQQRSLQNLINGLRDSTSSSNGSLRHAVYTITDYVDPCFGAISPATHKVQQTERAGDMSLDGTCFISKEGLVYAVICMGTADVSEWVVRSRQFGTQTFRVNVITRDASSNELSKRSFDVPFAWYDTQESLLGDDLQTTDSLPCFGQRGRCALCSVIPLRDMIQGSSREYEISVSNEIGSSVDEEQIEENINQIIEPLNDTLNLTREQLEQTERRVESLTNSTNELRGNVIGLQDRIIHLENAIDPCSGSGTGTGADSQELSELRNRVNGIDNTISGMSNTISELSEQVQQLSQGSGGGQGSSIDPHVFQNMRTSLRTLQDDLVALQARYQETTLWGTNTFAVLLCTKEVDGNVSHSWVYTNSDRVITFSFTPRVDFEGGEVSGAGVSIKLTYPFGILRVGTKNVQLKNLPLAMCIEYELTTEDKVVECHSVFNLTATNSSTVVFESILQPLVDIPWKIACIRFMEAHLPYTSRDMGSLGYVKDYEGEI